MKVGTDGVLLAAWAGQFPAERELDVGTGTGLIALALAASGVAHVDGVELDESAIFRATANVSENGLQRQVSIVHTSFQQFVSLISGFPSTASGSPMEARGVSLSGCRPYDLVVSNPPFFSQSLKSEHAGRTLARHDDALPFPELVAGTCACLAPDGVFAVIVPYDRMLACVAQATASGLYLHSRLCVSSRPGRGFHRALLAFGRRQRAVLEKTLTIYRDEQSFSDDFKELTRSLYLDEALL